MSDLGSKAAAEASAEPPSGVGEVFGQHSILARDMTDLSKRLCWHFHGLEASSGMEEPRFAASQVALCEDHT